MTDHENPRPSDSSDDQTFRRLRATDPAAAVEVDLAAIRRALDARLETDPAPTTVITPTPTTSARWVRVAAVAAAVALVGSAAFVVGRQSAGNGPAAPGTTAASAAGAQASSSTAGTRLPLSGGRPAGQESASSADQKLIGGGYGRTHFADGGLATDGGTAPAWGFDPSSVISAATAERIAAAMDVPGSATVQYQTWTVGPADGSGPSVSLTGDGQATVGYNDPQAYPTCVAVAGDPGAGATGGVSDPCEPTVPGDITADDAIARAVAVLTRIGLDPAGYTLTSPDDQAGGGYRSVTADLLLDGRATGLQFWFSFVGDRLASFSGGLAPVVSLGRYAVISPVQAVARLNDPRFGANASSGPIDTLRTEVGTPDVATSEVPTDTVPTPAAPVPGAPISWPVTEVTLTGATLGLSPQYRADGGGDLVPTWTLTDRDGGTWSVIAVADDQLDLTG